jgi:putative hemolysin
VVQGGTLDIRQGEGGEVGYCVFADGSECEEWALMRSECKPGEQANMPNPASENCVVQGGTVDIRQGDGGEVGYCVFADGSECEEWALMRGECKPGEQANMPNPASENCVAQGGTVDIRQGEGGEIGYCVFADGSECEEWALMRGECAPGTQAATFDDPFAYCATAGTIDAPDSRYTGAEPPPAVIEGIRKAFDAPADTPDDFYRNGTFWRCADGQVKACFVGANIPCETKADLSETPNEGTVAFCKENPDAEVVPAAAAGRATVFAWRCAGGAPIKGEQILQPDAQGFIADFWYTIEAPTSAAPQSLVFAPDLALRAARLKPVTVAPTVDTSKLEPWELQVLDKLKAAAAYMDAAYWQQVDPEGAAIFAGLSGDDAQSQAARLMMDANYGRWDRFDDFAIFLGSEPRPLGSYVYPADLTKAELDAYIAAHPDEKDALLSPYTVVRRDGDKLVAAPYHEVYAAYVEPAAVLLEEAAGLSQNASLTDYLRKQAQALRTDDYFDADMAWLDLDSNLDISIGPHETYDDQLAGQKSFYKANVLIVDRDASARLDAFKAAVPFEQANLPVPAAYRPDQTGTMTPIELADDILRTGQGRAVMEPVAFSLPNDPRVWAAKGAKKVMMRNFADERRAVVLIPLLVTIMDDEVNGWATPDGYFNWVLGHEVGHTLGPRTVLKDGQQVTIQQALGEHYQPIEEGKADITSLYNTIYLREQGVDPETLEAHYAGFLSEALRSIRFGPASAYGVIRSAAWNYFVEKGGLVYDPALSKFHVDMAKMPQAVEDLMVELLTIEGEGDATAAKAFLDQYSYVPDDLQALLDQANATAPVEFVPMYATQ